MKSTIKYFNLLFIVKALFFVSNAKAQLFNPQDIKLVSSQFSFTEGPAVNKKGAVFCWTANVCFGGKHRNNLFITSNKSLYIMPMNVKGVE